MCVELLEWRTFSSDALVALDGWQEHSDGTGAEANRLRQRRIAGR